MHINYVLVHAKNPKDAYRKAVELGKRGNLKYKNPDGKNVNIRFLGLRNLDVIHDPLEHGCEITFSEFLGVTKAGMRKLVRKKRELEAFLPIRDRPGRPDYASKEIMDEVAHRLATRKSTQPKRRGNRVSEKKRTTPATPSS